VSVLQRPHVDTGRHGIPRPDRVEPQRAGRDARQDDRRRENQRIQAPDEQFFFREWPPRGFEFPTPIAGAPTPTLSPNTVGPNAVFGGSRSSLGLPSYVKGLGAILVEMGQQQALERRVQLHVDIATEMLNRLEA
jgi:hypothetical protein